MSRPTHVQTHTEMDPNFTQNIETQMLPKPAKTPMSLGRRMQTNGDTPHRICDHYGVPHTKYTTALVVALANSEWMMLADLGLK